MSDDKNHKGRAFNMYGDWNLQSAELKKKFSELTDDDLFFEAGREKELLRRLETRLHKSREAVIAIIKACQPSKISRLMPRY